MHSQIWGNFVHIHRANMDISCAMLTSKKGRGVDCQEHGFESNISRVTFREHTMNT